MRRTLTLLALALSAALACAQTTVTTTGTYTWPKATTGVSGAQLGNYLVLAGTNRSRPTNYTIDASIAGTTPSVCTFNVQGSSDLTNWYTLDGGTTSCTASYMESIAYRPVLYLRIQLTYTQGDSTTSVIFHYTAAGGS